MSYEVEGGGGGLLRELRLGTVAPTPGLVGCKGAWVAKVVFACQGCCFAFFFALVVSFVGMLRKKGRADCECFFTCCSVVNGVA